ncbi:MAG: glutathione synthase [Myxococcota bacterium]
MTVQIGVVMDPIQSITTYKDTTFAMLLAAQAKGWQVWYMQQKDLWCRDGRTWATMQHLWVKDDAQHWFTLGEAQEQPLASLDVVLMRKDPPFDMEYVYTTYLLERAEEEGLLVLNKPQALRDANEKCYTAWFPEHTAPTLIARHAKRIKDFLQEHQHIVLKPLDGMGGKSIFSLKQGDPNVNVCIETLTDNGSRFAMAQRYLPEIQSGDKRILLIDGEVVPYALARIPTGDEFRGNLAVGGKGVAQPISAQERKIAEQIGPKLNELGMIFVGLDVIGEYLTEINVTSPTGLRELDAAYDLDLGGQLMDAIAKRLK